MLEKLRKGGNGIEKEKNEYEKINLTFFNFNFSGCYGFVCYWNDNLDDFLGSFNSWCNLCV